jgi:hypothetical protein
MTNKRTGKDESRTATKMTRAGWLLNGQIDGCGLDGGGSGGGDGDGVGTGGESAGVRVVGVGGSAATAA